MSVLLERLGAMAWQGAVLIVVVLAVRRLVRLDPYIRLLLWSVVLLRLLLPVLPTSSLSWLHLLSATPSGPLGGAASGERASSLLGAGLVACWVAGAVVHLGLRLRSARAWSRIVREGVPVDAPELLELHERCARRVGGRRSPRMVESPAVSTPALHGILDPVILLPVGIGTELSREGIRDVLLHELVHHRRRDLLLLAWVEVVVCLHWFHPLVRPMAARIRHDAELACDQRVVALLGGGGASYGRTLLSVAGWTRVPRPSPGTLSMAPGRDLEERVLFLARGHRRGRIARFASLPLVTGFAVAGLTDRKAPEWPAVSHGVFIYEIYEQPSTEEAVFRPDR